MSGPFLALLSSQYWEYELSPEVVRTIHQVKSLLSSRYRQAKVEI